MEPEMLPAREIGQCTEIVDGAVQRVERDGLLRMAPALQDHGSVSADVLDEALGELALAYTRRAVNADDDRLSRS